MSVGLGREGRSIFIGARNWGYFFRRTLLRMINLDSILKIRDITLPTKAHLVKAMVFP